MCKVHRVSLASRKGLGEIVTTLIAIPFFAVVIGFLAYFGRALVVRGALEEAAAAGARFAVTSLSGQKGCAQAKDAMFRVLQGYQLDPSAAQIAIQPITVWGRGERAAVHVAYRVPQSHGLFFMQMLGEPTVRAYYEVVIDRYNNRFSNGWLPCTTAPAG
jgi:Flp pilus assembly protein TadG